MKFKYTGDKDAPKTINFMGRMEFNLGETREVADPLLIEKMTGNRSFEQIETKKRKSKGS